MNGLNRIIFRSGQSIRLRYLESSYLSKSRTFYSGSAILFPRGFSRSNESQSAHPAFSGSSPLNSPSTGTSSPKSTSELSFKSADPSKFIESQRGIPFRVRDRNSSDVFEPRGGQRTARGFPRGQFNPETEFGQQFPSNDFRPTRDRFRTRDSNQDSRSGGRNEFSRGNFRRPPGGGGQYYPESEFQAQGPSDGAPSTRPFRKRFSEADSGRVSAQKPRFGVHSEFSRENDREFAGEQSQFSSGGGFRDRSRRFPSESFPGRRRPPFDSRSAPDSRQDFDQQPYSPRAQRRTQSAPGRGGAQWRESQADESAQFEGADRQSADASRHYMRRAFARSGMRPDAGADTEGGASRRSRPRRAEGESAAGLDPMQYPIAKPFIAPFAKSAPVAGRGAALAEDDAEDAMESELAGGLSTVKQLLEGRELDEVLRFVELNHEKFDPLDVSFCVMHVRKRVKESGREGQRAALQTKLLGDERFMLLTLLAAKFARYLYRFSFLYTFRDLLRLWGEQFPKRPLEVFLEVSTSHVNAFSIRQLCSLTHALIDYRHLFQAPASPLTVASSTPSPTAAVATAASSTAVTSEKEKETAGATLAANISKLHAALLESIRLVFRERRTELLRLFAWDLSPVLRVTPLQTDAEMHRFVLEILLDEANRLEHNRQLAERLHVAGLLPSVFALEAIAESVAHESQSLPAPDDVHALFVPLGVKEYAGPPLYQTVARKFLGFLERNGEHLAAWESGIGRRLTALFAALDKLRLLDAAPALLAAVDALVERHLRDGASQMLTRAEAAALAVQLARCYRPVALPAMARQLAPQWPLKELSFEQNLALLECAADAGASQAALFSASALEAFEGAIPKERADARIALAFALHLRSRASSTASEQQTQTRALSISHHLDLNSASFSSSLSKQRAIERVLAVDLSSIAKFDASSEQASKLRGLAAHYCKAMDEVASSSGTSKAHNAAIDDLQSSLLELFGEAQVRRVKTSSEATSFFDLFSTFAIEKSEGARAAIVVNSWFNSLQLPVAPTTPAPAAEVKSAAGTLSDQRTLVSSRSLLTEQLARLCAPECPLIQIDLPEFARRLSAPERRAYLEQVLRPILSK